MFRNLQIVRLRAAEKALREGLLDEAYRLASAADLRENRRAAGVLASLTEKFLERARVNYRADRYSDALIDLDRADAGGVLKDQIAELRGYIQTVASEKHRQDNVRRDRIDQAVRRIESGSVEAGRLMLDGIGANDPAVNELRRAAEDRAAAAEKIAEHAEQLIALDRLAEAGQNIRKAKAADARNERITQLEAQLSDRVLGNARSALERGLPGRAADELACLGDLGKSLPARRELADLIALVKECGDAVRSHRYDEAQRVALILARRMPDAPWVQTVVEQLRGADEIHTALGAGPLGERTDIVQTVAGRKAGFPTEDTLVIPVRKPQDAKLSERLLLLVDGAGSYLLLRGGQVSVGRAASGHPADVPLFSDVAERHANIARVDDDYFIFSRGEIEVGGRNTQHQLLRDGDRIVLGRKAKLTFRMPSRKSPSAVLELSDTTKMPNDVRRVVLFHRNAVLANSSAAHVFCRNAEANLVLYERDGSLWIRPQGAGMSDAESHPLRPGEPLEVRGVSMVLKPWPAGIGGTAT